MSKLIQIRQRIKAIETIQKVTHAMRLISMSSHTRLRKKQESMQAYVAQIGTLFAHTRLSVPDWTHHLAQPPAKDSNKKLIIIVGSQRSLCGSFNSHMMNEVSAYLKTEEAGDYTIIAIGKKIIELLQDTVTIDQEFNTFTSTTHSSVTQDITRILLKAPETYACVEIFSNELKTFFVQRPVKTVLMPCTYPLTHGEGEERVQEFTWEHDPSVVLDTLLTQYMEARVYHILFESLLAEQAARFISMDNSTRNAKSLLETTQSQYNKLRQAKITKELTELSGHYSNQ